MPASPASITIRPWPNWVASRAAFNFCNSGWRPTNSLPTEATGPVIGRSGSCGIFGLGEVPKSMEFGTMEFGTSEAVSFWPQAMQKFAASGLSWTQLAQRILFEISLKARQRIQENRGACGNFNAAGTAPQGVAGHQGSWSKNNCRLCGKLEPRSNQCQWGTNGTRAIRKFAAGP